MTKTCKLGKGLSVLLNTNLYDNPDNELKYLKLELIFPNEEQPRKFFDQEKLNELSDSIKQHGVIEPIIVFKHEQSNKYIIISGERRWRAAKLANLAEIPAILKKIDKITALEIALVENIQRQDLNLIEEAEGYKQLIVKYQYTQEDISKIVGKSRSYIANILRLNNLSKYVKDKLSTGKITMGHAKILIGLDNADEIVEIIINKSLNVRQAENLVSKLKSYQIKQKKQTNQESNLMLREIMNIKENLKNSLNLDVEIESKNNKGKLILFYNNMTELDNILSKLT